MIATISIIISMMLSIGAIVAAVAIRLNDVKHIKEDIECLYEKYKEQNKKIDKIANDVAYIKGKMDIE